MTIRIVQNQSETQYAADELARFLAQFTAHEILRGEGEAESRVTLTVDPALEAHAWSVHGDGQALEIRGGNASSVLCGVSDALAEAGILFEATGYTAPLGFDPDAFFRVNRDVNPKFRLRGVRQHINFPMDISSYPLKDAEEYIRALARMRFNAITFHSYAGQWHGTKPGERAGHFF